MTFVLNPPPSGVPKSLREDNGIRGYFITLTNSVYQMWDLLRSVFAQAKVTTTDATVTTLQTIAIDLDTTKYIRAEVVARRTGGSAGSAGDSAFYRLIACYNNASGTVGIVGAISVVSGEDQAGWDCTFTVSGTDVLLRVTGAVDNNISWLGTVTSYAVGV